MNYITCDSDIQFWASWIDSVVEVEVVTYNPRVPPPATATLDSVPVARVVPMKAGTVSRKATESTVIQNEDLKATIIQHATVIPLEPADSIQEGTVSERPKSENPAVATVISMDSTVAQEPGITETATVTHRPNVATVSQNTVHEVATVTPQKTADSIDEGTVSEQPKSEEPEISGTKKILKARQKRDKKK
ncbi:hypothetical protein CAEBREN_25569 [Caenorhabditis brenneri]|uniref:Uncharacterized protein n=1 Tax=Caenorhabditis brenneri TaxID=135651 RepID=G0MFG3_CAEBE|nr:hypothetical protein CAEBREN_25569 [Caenorhabditis brenneri]